MSKNKSPQAEANKYAILWKTMFPGQFPIDVKKIALGRSEQPKNSPAHN